MADGNPEFCIDGPGLYATSDEVLVEIVGKSFCVLDSERLGVYRTSGGDVDFDHFDDQGSGAGLILVRKCIVPEGY